ncbi:MAG: hypothetical protein IV097_00505 [Burkholderiaceae bacterium]|nr:hypothetical protein [Burkholderiaceae bacterium]
MQRTRTTCATSAAPFRSPSLTRFLVAKNVQSVKPTTARPPRESSANSTPYAPADQQAELPGASHPDQQQGPEFDPRGWAVHLKMLANRGKLVRVALAEVKKELQAPDRSPRAKSTRTAKKAKAMIAGACA